MYNRILKRPMFKMGGRSYSAQGTGITSGLDTPKRGLVDGPGGYAGDTREIINTEREEIFKTPEGQNIRDVISSFGAYASPYKDDGTAKTSGEIGYEQATDITKLRKDRKDQQDLAKLTNLESREAKIIADEKFEADKQITKLGIRELEIDAQNRYFQEADKLYREALNKTKSDEFPQGNPSAIPQDVLRKIEDLKTIASKGKYFSYADAVIAAEQSFPLDNAKLFKEFGMEGITALREAHIYKLTGGMFGAPLPDEYKAEGGRVGYNIGTGMEGAQPMQAGMSVSETIDTPNMEMTETETMQSSDTDALGIDADPAETYKLLRAKLPQEITDEVVQLISYNVKAFEDFAAIEDQEGVIDFNNKYGVELVLPAATV